MLSLVVLLSIGVEATDFLFFNQDFIISTIYLASQPPCIILGVEEAERRLRYTGRHWIMPREQRAAAGASRRGA